MPNLKNDSKNTIHIWNKPKNIHVDANPGVTKLTEDQAQALANDIANYPELSFLEDINDVPAKKEPAQEPTASTQTESVADKMAKKKLEKLNEG